jgi:hypothetical protein
MGHYRKVDPRFWKDEKVRRLSIQEKAIALYVITAFAKGFANVIGTLQWEWEQRSRVIYIPTWWKYNQPENDNNVIGCLKDLEDLPDSPLISKFCVNLTYLEERFHQTFTQTLQKRYPQRLATPEPELELEPELEKEPSLVPLSGEAEKKVVQSVFTRELSTWFQTTFWPAYPRKEREERAWKAMLKLKPDPAMRDRIMVQLEQWKTCRKWQEGYALLASNWIGEGEWKNPAPQGDAHANGRGSYQGSTAKASGETVGSGPGSGESDKWAQEASRADEVRKARGLTG